MSKLINAFLINIARHLSTSFFAQLHGSPLYAGYRRQVNKRALNLPIIVAKPDTAE
ncbi:MAG: hypothetical protein ABI472_21360 [Ginsengibacter sp.]